MLTNNALLARLISTGSYSNVIKDEQPNETSNFIALLDKCDPEFIAKAAIYSKEEAYMKDMPAMLLAYLAGRGHLPLLISIFDRVCDNGKIIKNFVKFIRLGTFGRKSLGERPKKLVQNWINSKSETFLWRNSIGNNPSLVDVIKLCHVKANTQVKDNFIKYLMGKDYNFELLPLEVQNYERFLKDKTLDLPKAPFEMLSSSGLTDSQWKDLALNMSWTQLKNNLNTLLRHNVFDDTTFVNKVAEKLSTKKLVKDAKVFPYQLFVAYLNMDKKIPSKIIEALGVATEYATENVIDFSPWKLKIFLDVSGSMHWQIYEDKFVNGKVIPAPKVTSLQAASVVSASLLRKNSNVELIPFSNRISKTDIDYNKSILEIAQDLGKIPSGGTNCSLPIRYLIDNKLESDICIMLSDYESNLGESKGTYRAWNEYQKVSQSMLFCIDFVPNRAVEVPNSDNVINISGFSDNIWNNMRNYLNSFKGESTWESQINSISLEKQ